MVYESDYSTRRVYSGSRPVVSTSYSYSTPSRSYISTDPSPSSSSVRRVVETRTVRSSDSLGGTGPSKSYSTTSESTTRDYGAGPRTYSYSTESTRSTGGPGSGGSYFSTASYKSPYGNNYRDFSYNNTPAPQGRKQQHRVIIPLPRMVHQRLIPVSAPPHRHGPTNVYEALETGRRGNSYVLMNYRVTPPPPRSRVVYIEDVTSDNLDAIDRETRSVHRDMDNMLYRVSAGLPFSSSSLYNMHHIPMRSASEVKEVADMRRLYVRDRNPGLGWNPLNKASIYRMPYSHYTDPAAVDPKHYYIGRQHLACLSFAGGRPIPKRRRFYPGYEDKIMDDVTVRSYYTKLRNQANLALNANRKYLRSTQYQPLHYSRKTIMGGTEPKREIQESKWVKIAMANEKEPPKKPEPTEPAKPAPARRESLTKEPKPEPPAPSRPLNVTLPGPRKSVTEIIKEDMPKVENLPEESITVRRPSKMETVPGTPPVEAKAEETFVLPIKAKEPTPPPPKEPTPPPREPTPPPKEPTPPPKEPTPPPREPTPPPPPKEPTPPPKEPTPPPKEPTPPPKEPTPPPKEPTPPPKEATPPPPPPKEATPPPPPKEATPPPPPKEATPPPTEPEAAGEEKSVSGVAEGSEVESNKGEVAEIPLDEDDLCDVDVGAQNDLAFEEDPPAENGPVEEVPPPQEAEEAQAEPQPAQEETVLDAETPSGVSILVADIDGPVEVEVGVVAQEPMSVEQIQAEAERRRTDFARLLEEHHDIVEQVELLEHPAFGTRLDTVPEGPSPTPSDKYAP